MGEILRSRPEKNSIAKVHSNLKLEGARSHMSVRMTIKVVGSNLKNLIDTECINFIHLH